MYKVHFSKRVFKFFNKRNSKFKEKFVNLFDEIGRNPFIGNLDIKPLRGHKNHYRLRMGKYRVLFEVRQDDRVVICYDADSRGGAYK